MDKDADSDTLTAPPLVVASGAVELATRTKVLAVRPPMYKVVMLNDDYTPMDFVVTTLMEVFNRSQADATRIMLDIHNLGSGICGVYTRDIAETKAEIVIEKAQSQGHPLQCVVEPEPKPAIS
ncbi:ATP-dependent Clp protease adapter ClpS [bacterium]|nr:ATP-dependent Clp protease adapter ClpS [bacterium]